MTGTINSEARLSTFEAICMIVGNSIGTGIIAVPYLADVYKRQIQHYGSWLWTSCR